MTVDVTGKVLPGDRFLRISSNMELYWDRIVLAPIEPASTFTAREASAHSADLHYLGYPREYTPDGRQPNLLDYHNLDRSVTWKTMEGSYTRYGDVRELLEAADNCYVIMGPGEEVTLRFAAEAFGPVPAGRSRTFLLKTDSYCKDMDRHTASPDTVGPLPFHAMSAYPYRSDEKYPDTEKTRSYRQRYNMRPVSRR